MLFRGLILLGLGVAAAPASRTRPGQASSADKLRWSVDVVQDASDTSFRVTSRSRLMATANVSVWPSPQNMQSGANELPIDVGAFQFVYAGARSDSRAPETTAAADEQHWQQLSSAHSTVPRNGSEALDILSQAFLRYYSIIFGADGRLDPTQLCVSGGAACGSRGSSSFNAGHSEPRLRSQHAQTSASEVLTLSSSDPAALSSLQVYVASLDDRLQSGVDESYQLNISGTSSGDSASSAGDTSSLAAASTATLSCATVYGCLRGLETFSQLVIGQADADGTTSYAITGAPLVISDHPRFQHRGMLIDTSRHFLPLATLLNVVDGLAYDKSNVFHWHITDVQSFPYASAAVPELAAHGSWAAESNSTSTAAIYSLTDMASVVRYAKYRGVRVIPELDNPAHALSWAAGRPDIVVPCPSNVYSSVLDPTTNATYDVLTSLFTELSSIFIDDVMHVGGDEVVVDNTSCYNWPHVNEWMAQTGIAAGDYKAVARYHISRVQDIVAGLRPNASCMNGKSASPASSSVAADETANRTMTMAVWEEVLDHYGPGTTNPTPAPAFLDINSTMVYMWFCPCWQWFNMSYITQLGFRGVKADDWYMDSLSDTWQQMYSKDPLTNAQSCDYSAGWANCTCGQSTGCFNITQPEQVSLVAGGESSMWGELIDESNLIPTVWPRHSAVSERLWSPQQINDPMAAQWRLVDHRCRLKARGIAAGPIQPDWCDGSRR